jgi:hypothetical protein
MHMRCGVTGPRRSEVAGRPSLFCCPHPVVHLCAQVEVLAKEMEWGLEFVEAVEGSEDAAACMEGRFTGSKWVQLQVDTDDAVSQLASL